MATSTHVVGVATHAAAKGEETLNADATRLAGEILKIFIEESEELRT